MNHRSQCSSAFLRALFLFLFLFSGLISELAQAEQRQVRIAYGSVGADNKPLGGNSAATAYFRKSIEQEFKDDPSVKVEWIVFRGAGPAMNEALANKQVDFALIGDLPSLAARASGLDTRLLLASGAHSPIYLAVPLDSPVKSVKELKGRKVALFFGTNNHLSVVKVLAANGLSIRDVHLINLDNAATNAALIGHDVDAAFGNYPLLSLASQGKARIAYTTKGDKPEFERHAFVQVRNEYQRVNPDLTQRVVNGFVKASQWSSEEGNREALVSLWAESGTPAEIYRTDLDGSQLKYRNSPLIDDFIISQLKVQLAQAQEFKLIRQSADVDGWYEPRYLETALRALKLQNYWVRQDANGTPLRAAN